MAACPVGVSPSPARRRRMVLSQRRIDANRRNALRSTGPRTREGKDRVARNAIKHGFFTAIERWAPEQQRDFGETFLGLCADFQPTSPLEEALVASMAESYVRMAAVLRYEGIAALEEHRRRDRELDARITAARPTEAARLRGYREELRAAGLWQPSIPGEREANTILRLLGRLERDISYATSRLRARKDERSRGFSPIEKMKKQSHFSTSSRSGPEAPEGPERAARRGANTQKQTHFGSEATAISADPENEKTNPLNPMIAGNRHERRRAKALLRRRK